MAYKWVLWSLDGTALGEVNNAYEATCKPRLNGLGTASFRVRLDNSLGVRIMDASDLNGGVLCGVYRDTTLVFIGELTTAEEVGPGYKILLDREGMCNRAWSLPAADYVASADYDSITANGLYDVVVPGDFPNVLLRKAWTDANVAARAQPRRIVTIEPITDDTKPSISCNFADPLWRLSKRLVDKGTAPVTHGVTTPITRGQLIEDLLTYANSERDTGIRIGTVDTGYDIQVGTSAGDDGWSFKPHSEAMTELAAAPTIPFEVPSTYIGRDNFNAQSAGALTGKTGQTGGLWGYLGQFTAAGSNRDFTVQATGGASNGPSAYRGAVVSPEDANTWEDGHFALLATGQTTDTLSSVDYKCDYLGSNHYFGLYARMFDFDVATQMVLATVSFGVSPPILYLLLVDFAGPTVQTTVASVPLTSWALNTFYTLRLGADSEGRLVVWHFDTAASPSGAPPVLTAVRSEVATGGQYEQGYSGIYSRNSSQFGNVVIDNFWHSVPVIDFVAAGIDFEFAPSVPTVDSNQSGVVGAGLKIATLNAPVHIGTSKPHAVFNRGDGAKQNPAFSSDYILGDSCPARLKAAGSTRLNATVRTYGVDIVRDSEGRITETPILVPES